MSKTVISIHEENHGTLAVAADYKSAIHFLIKHEWLFGDMQAYNKELDDWKPVRAIYGENWQSLFMNEWDIDQFNEVFDGWLYLRLEKVYDMSEENEE